MSSSTFTAVRSVGGLLPNDTLSAIAAGRGLDGLTGADYHLLPGEALRGEANRAWQRLLGAWRVFRDSLTNQPQADVATGVTRERWLLPLFQELGYGRLETAPAGGVIADDKAFPVSHLWRANPIHLLGAGVDLDRRTGGVAGAAKAAPHSMVQELLNRTDAYLWAFLSNGRTLRVLRDNASLVRQAYLEFDLEAIFDGELFNEFVLLYLVCHQSRVENRDETGPGSCWLETWRSASLAAGTRALEHLRGGVVQALRAFGAGFLRHPANSELRDALRTGGLTPQDYYRELLRLAYRLLFLFVAEDRDLLHHPDATPQARDRYARYFSTSRLRQLARRPRTADRHPDLWRSVQVVVEALGIAEGLPALGLPYLGGFLFDDALSGPLAGAQLANRDLLSALRPLALVRDDGGLTRAVDYRNLDSEELGSVYESLLQLVPQIDPASVEFRLEEIAGNERKTTGSYYTPSSLISSLLDTALDPLLDRAIKDAVDHTAAERALLDLTVCDPACGSGHFLVAAARRIAKRLAEIRTGDPEPAPTAVRTALRDVIGHCIYGVDLNDLAAELAKVSLWLEALEPGKPLSFLDAKIRVGNALLGTTPALLAAGIPDDAFAQLTGDDRKHTADLKKRNKRERENAHQGELFTANELHLANTSIAARRAEIDAHDDSTAAGIAARADAWRRLESSRELREARFLADAWCAAFVWPKVPAAQPAITDATYRRMRETPQGTPAEVRETVEAIAKDHRFFHWHLEFPEVFRVTDDLAGLDNPEQGWSGGFSAVLGNPPWERIKLQEQEYFAARDPDIATAPNAAARRRMIAALSVTNPPLLAAFEAAKRRAEGESHFLRNSGRYPFCGRGDINTYAVFAETALNCIGRDGRSGVIVPSGIATDDTTKLFFQALVDEKSLVSLFEFENEGFFTGIGQGHMVRFCLLTIVRTGFDQDKIRFLFQGTAISDLSDSDRIVALSAEDLVRVNPNTHTAPIFRTRRDAVITLDVYERVPILDLEQSSASPWLPKLSTMFHMSNDAGLFRTASELLAAGAELVGNEWHLDETVWVPLYEAKMFSSFDHRAGSYEGLAGRAHQLPAVPDEKKSDCAWLVQPWYWVEKSKLPSEERSWTLAWRDTSDSRASARTVIASVLPRVALSNKAPVLASARRGPEVGMLPAIMNSVAFDYLARQKIAGTTLNFFIVRQLPFLHPDQFAAPCAWDANLLVLEWLVPRVVELAYTATDLAGYARELGDEGPPFVWNVERRALLMAELDAAFFELYGFAADDVAHALDTFPVLRRKEEAAFGEYRTKRLILEVGDSMAKAIASGSPYNTMLSPPPGHGPRHSAV